MKQLLVCSLLLSMNCAFAGSKIPSEEIFNQIRDYATMQGYTRGGLTACTDNKNKLIVGGLTHARMPFRVVILATTNGFIPTESVSYNNEHHEKITFKNENTLFSIKRTPTNHAKKHHEGYVTYQAIVSYPDYEILVDCYWQVKGSVH